MSEKNIPEFVDPYRFAEQQLRLIGVVEKADMQRLETTPNLGDHAVQVDLRFGVDEQGINFLKGHLQTKLALECQRCMEPFIYEIISDFTLGIVSTLDEADALPDCYEPALVKDGKLALRELIEDEVILNLPIIPKHEPENCKMQLPLAGEGQTEKGENPFHVLKSLKNLKSKD